MKLKYIYLLLPVLFCAGSAKAQLKSFDDSLIQYRHRYALAKTDSNLYKLYDRLNRHYRRSNPDSGLHYGRLVVQLAKKNNKIIWELDGQEGIGFCLAETGNLPEALNIYLRMLELSKQLKNVSFEAVSLNRIGNIYLEMGDPRTALNYYQASLAAIKSIRKTFTKDTHYWIANETSNIGNAYEKLNLPDSALFYEEPLYNEKKLPIDLLPELLSRLGNANVMLAKYQAALNYYRQGSVLALPVRTVNDFAIINYQMAKMDDEKLHLPDSGIYYARKALIAAKSISYRNIMLNSAQLLADLYGRSANKDSAYYYQKIAMRYNDTLFGAEKFSHIQRILSDEQQRQQKLLDEQQTQKQRYQLMCGIAVLLFVIVIALLVWRNNLSQRKKNKLLDEQKKELTEQRDELQNTLVNLGKTQKQLIQSEKMASLGELTAGIAHEIQNPLNFVNNFSEVSKELMDELTEELDKGDTKEAKVISQDVIQNLEKIAHHGKRADAIVKGMLQHSQSGSGAKEPTNINSLADEYLRLSYHGSRSKDKSFNAEMVTHFDEKLPDVNVIPQDIGRVMLNLFNNAFYAVNQKKKTAGATYKAEVSVTTSVENALVVIKVKDNGTGIPDAIKEKIMQPFFTTKPTGEGTGLGLSLTYDMVVKGHGGKIDINTKEGEFTEFIVTLPV